jgi:hypothetical protein
MMSTVMSIMMTSKSAGGMEAMSTVMRTMSTVMRTMLKRTVM